jgi:5-methyltetrahydrofolate--homocysteine methyltransferase
MNNMHTTMEALKTAGVRGREKVIIGGMPVADDYARKIGADAFAPDASSAVRVVRKMLA